MDPFLKPQKVTREHTFCSLGGKAASKIVQEESGGCLISFSLYSDHTVLSPSCIILPMKGWGLGQNCLLCISFKLKGEKKKSLKKKLQIGKKWAVSWARLLHTEVPFSTESGPRFPALRDNIQKEKPPHSPF